MIRYLTRFMRTTQLSRMRKKDYCTCLVLFAGSNALIWKCSNQYYRGPLFSLLTDFLSYPCKPQGKAAP